MAILFNSLRVGDIIRVDEFPDAYDRDLKLRRVCVVYLGKAADEETILAAGIATVHGFQEIKNGTFLPHTPGGDPSTGLTQKSAVHFDWVKPVTIENIVEKCGRCSSLKRSEILDGVQKEIAKHLNGK